MQFVPPATAPVGSGPLVIAHRGASGHRPEHTALAYRLGYRMGADSVEPDLVLTRDGVLVCRHDLDLTRTTDVADRPEFASRRSRISLGGKILRGFFVHDFDLEELRSLTVRERWPRKRPGNARYDGQLGVVTFAELLDLRDEESARAGRQLQVHAEIKHPSWFASVGLPIEDVLADVVAERGLNRPNTPLRLMTFESATLRRLAERTTVPMVQLLGPSGGPADGSRATYKKMARRPGLARIAEYASAVGPHKSLVLPADRHGDVSRPSALVEKAHARGLDVLVWTLRNENRHLPANLRTGEGARIHGHAETEATMLLDAGVDGLLTDHPDLAVRVLSRRTLPLAAGS